MAKILIHSLVFPPDAISNAYVLADLARALKGYGHELMVLTTTPHYNLVEEDLHRQPMTPVKGQWLLRSEFDGIPCYHIQVPPVKGGAGTRLKTALRFHALGLRAAFGAQFKCDIVISQSPPLTTGLVGSWIARRHGAKCLYIVQDVFPDGLVRQGTISNKALIRMLRWLERWVYRSNNAVSVISDGILRTLRPRIPSGVALEVIPNFVDTDLYRPLPRVNAFTRASHVEDRFVISYVGNIGNAQDFTPVLAAAKACADLPLTFLLVGDGIKRARLAEAVARDGLENISLPGYQTRDVTPLINAASDIGLILLAPHVGSFGLPSKVYSLMACGTPIILVGDPKSDVAQLITRTGAGWVIPSGANDEFVETVRTLYQQRASLSSYGQRGVQAVEASFTLPRVAQRYHDLITRLVGPRA